MRELNVEEISQKVAQLSIEANCFLGDDLIAALGKALEGEESTLGKKVIRQIVKNAEIAAKDQVPICQDTGVAVVFLELGQEVRVTGGELKAAVDEGIRKGYTDGYLRKSMVTQPFSARSNTKDNTPAIIHTDIVPGDKLKIALLPKGSGSENMSTLGMLKPAQGKEGIIDFVIQVVDKAGSNCCPPIVVGIGIGGTTEKAMLLAKKALLRRIAEPNPDLEVAELERELLRRINALGIGPMGYGGRTTALAVHAEAMPSHLASLPVGINLQCHAARHKQATL